MPPPASTVSNWAASQHPQLYGHPAQCSSHSFTFHRPTKAPLFFSPAPALASTLIHLIFWSPPPCLAQYPQSVAKVTEMPNFLPQSLCTWDSLFPKLTSHLHKTGALVILISLIPVQGRAHGYHHSLPQAQHNPEAAGLPCSHKGMFRTDDDTVHGSHHKPGSALGHRS